VDTWLVWKLTGGASHVTEPGNASRTMLFDIDRLAWDDDLFSLHPILRFEPDPDPPSIPSRRSGTSSVVQAFRLSWKEVAS
jgi:glycerol kinase